jgi:hypothetical protein
LLGDFTARMGREDVFKPTIENENLQVIVMPIAVKIVNLPNQFSYITTFINLLGYLMERHNQIGHILIDMRRHSSIRDEMSFRVTD